ncbi:MAG: 30S ribosomal protein S8 [Candidatus Peribacter sp.]|jgi:small subunit ribosomal protein S8|nr:30S ribosomal protein S8 [Candidatus Peribacter sp.]MBT4392517.1 30S ribosomal protein S8 [Candidatus Peribacter sp.]MBT4601402.1 30S ribosomal protein S8 [Candidatus Peribacter sp.]MBT5149540.1 30S ribosomal protein S8 [Candidatus Peribacter sp.]MBT5638092.1 30S ribosomal protein S8 [Candidatus Peribacter sp.]
MTYVTDPIGDLLTRMRNAQKAGKASTTAPHSKLKLQLLELLKKEGWISTVEVLGEAPKLTLEVTFNPEKSSLTLTRASKPGRRTYAGVADLKPVLRGFGMAVLTTSQGLLSDSEARQKKVGGEVLCTIS